MDCSQNLIYTPELISLILFKNLGYPNHIITTTSQFILILFNFNFFFLFQIALHLPKGNRPKSPSQIETLFNPPSPLPPSSPSFSTHSPPSSPFKPPSSPFLPLLSSSSSFPPVSVSFQTKIGRRRGEGGDFVINVKVFRAF